MTVGWRVQTSPPLRRFSDMHAAEDPLAPPAPFATFERLASGRALVWDLTLNAAEARRVAPALEAAFTHHDALAVAGSRRLRADGSPNDNSVSAQGVSAHGVFVLHPKGFFRNGRGAPRDGERFDCEVDAIDAGVMVVDAEAFAIARGEALLDPRAGYGALAMLSLSLEIRRRRAGRVVAVAAATICETDASDALMETQGFNNQIASSHFRSHFGFAADACDLDAVASNPSLAGLRWNAAVWGASAPFEKYDERGAYHWNLYATHDAYRRRADTLASFLVANTPPGAQRVIDVGAGDALFAGLIARQGMHAVAIDPEPQAIACARVAIAAAELSDRVECMQGSAQSIAFPDATFRAAMLLDVIEHLRNPMRDLAEIRRVLIPGGVLLVATPNWRYGHRNDPVYHLDEYRDEELTRQLRACGFEVMTTAHIKGAYDDVVVLARRR